MSLFEEQNAFMIDLARLIIFAKTNGFLISGRELARSPEQQKIYVDSGRSQTMNSNHLKNLAIDLYFMKDGQVIYDIPTLSPIGQFWEQQSPKNSAGMFWKSFKDVPHFERRV